jgi:predicted 3-demethylubiquinone-9 3-methyltransferase (glyoxalase superfamily)
MITIAPHLWYDTEAREAAELYVSTFEGSRIRSTIVLHGTPSGSVEIVTAELAGQEFTLLSAGPKFRFTPAISFLVSCRTSEEVDAIWSRLADGGKALMELASYPFSERYGWTEDRYGVSWQVMHAGERTITQKIIPTLLFVGEVCGKAEEAIHFYTSVLPGSSPGPVDRYGKGEEPDREGTVKHASFTLAGQQFGAMDSAHAHDFTFNDAVSLMVRCDSQQEIDEYWSRLSAVPEAEVCGWLKDRYGVSWQITPSMLDEILATGDARKLERVTEALLKMKKLDIATLERAVEG